MVISYAKLLLLTIAKGSFDRQTKNNYTNKVNEITNTMREHVYIACARLNITEEQCKIYISKIKQIYTNITVIEIKNTKSEESKQIQPISAPPLKPDTAQVRQQKIKHPKPDERELATNQLRELTKRSTEIQNSIKKSFAEELLKNQSLQVWLSLQIMYLKKQFGDHYTLFLANLFIAVATIIQSINTDKDPKSILVTNAFTITPICNLNPNYVSMMEAYYNSYKSFAALAISMTVATQSLPRSMP